MVTFPNVIFFSNACARARFIIQNYSEIQRFICLACKAAPEPLAVALAATVGAATTLYIVAILIHFILNY